MFKLKSFIPEIKIVPNSLPKNNYELANYLNRNRNSFLYYIEDNFIEPIDYFGGVETLNGIPFEYIDSDDIVRILNGEGEGFLISLNPIAEEIHGEDAEQIEVEYKGLKLYLHF